MTTSSLAGISGTPMTWMKNTAGEERPSGTTSGIGSTVGTGTNTGGYNNDSRRSQPDDLRNSYISDYRNQSKVSQSMTIQRSTDQSKAIVYRVVPETGANTGLGIQTVDSHDSPQMDMRHQRDEREAFSDTTSFVDGPYAAAPLKHPREYSGSSPNSSAINFRPPLSDYNNNTTGNKHEPRNRGKPPRVPQSVPVVVAVARSGASSARSGKKSRSDNRESNLRYNYPSYVPRAPESETSERSKMGSAATFGRKHQQQLPYDSQRTSDRLSKNIPPRVPKYYDSPETSYSRNQTTTAHGGVSDYRQTRDSPNMVGDSLGGATGNNRTSNHHHHPTRVQRDRATYGGDNYHTAPLQSMRMENNTGNRSSLLAPKHGVLTDNYLSSDLKRIVLSELPAGSKILDSKVLTQTVYRPPTTQNSPRPVSEIDLVSNRKVQHISASPRGSIMLSSRAPGTTPSHLQQRSRPSPYPTTTTAAHPTTVHAPGTPTSTASTPLTTRTAETMGVQPSVSPAQYMVQHPATVSYGDSSLPMRSVVPGSSYPYPIAVGGMPSYPYVMPSFPKEISGMLKMQHEAAAALGLQAPVNGVHPLNNLQHPAIYNQMMLAAPHGAASGGSAVPNIPVKERHRRRRSGRARRHRRKREGRRHRHRPSSHSDDTSSNTTGDSAAVPTHIAVPYIDPHHQYVAATPRTAAAVMQQHQHMIDGGLAAAPPAVGSNIFASTPLLPVSQPHIQMQPGAYQMHYQSPQHPQQLSNPQHPPPQLAAVHGKHTMQRTGENATDLSSVAASSRTSSSVQDGSARRHKQQPFYFAPSFPSTNSSAYDEHSAMSSASSTFSSLNAAVLGGRYREEGHRNLMHQAEMIAADYRRPARPKGRAICC
eukprot:Lankesteria_metandrocarpae@DN4633_c0_g1_i2.p1